MCLYIVHTKQLVGAKYLKLNILLNYKHFQEEQNYLIVIGRVFSSYSEQIKNVS